MPPIGPISRRDLIATFRKLGWTGPHAGRKHAYMSLGDRDQRIPNPHQGDISTSMLREIVRQAGISRAEWERA
ncbi:MAG: type II toxin-antitoxin system HicA family toxin [Thermomicrobiales bacterium]